LLNQVIFHFTVDLSIRLSVTLGKLIYAQRVVAAAAATLTGNVPFISTYTVGPDVSEELMSPLVELGWWKGCAVALGLNVVLSKTQTAVGAYFLAHSQSMAESWLLMFCRLTNTQ
jgi:hypothetical protein